MDRNPYDILGVSRSASDEEIKKAYREKAKEYHPDTCDRDDATEVFRRIQKAYKAAISEKSQKGEEDANPNADKAKRSDKKQQNRAKRNEAAETGGSREQQGNRRSEGDNSQSAGTNRREYNSTKAESTRVNSDAVGRLIQFGILVYILLTIIEAVTRLDLPIPPT